MTVKMSWDAKFLTRYLKEVPLVNRKSKIGSESIAHDSEAMRVRGIIVLVKSN